MASKKLRALKINLAIGFTRKNRIGKAVMMLYLEATSRIFRTTANFENLIYLYFRLPASQPTNQPACLP